MEEKPARSSEADTERRDAFLERPMWESHADDLPVRGEGRRRYVARMTAQYGDDLPEWVVGNVERNFADVPAWPSRSWAEFRDHVEAEPVWIVPGVVPAGALGFLPAAPKRGKTWLAVDLAIGLVSGRSWLGVPIPEPVPVLYAALEGQPQALRARIGCLARGRGLDPDSDLSGLRISTRRDAPAPDLMKTDWGDALYDEATAHAAKLVIVDVIRAAAPHLRETGEGAVDFAQVKANIAELLADGVTVLFLHHFVKGSHAEDRFTGELMTGSGALYGAMDFGIFIKPSIIGEHWEREMPLVFEMRDHEPPPPMTVKLEGEGGGVNGSLRYLDAAQIITAAGTSKEGRLAETITDFLGAFKEHEGWAPTTAVTGNIKGDHKVIRTMLKSLTATGVLVHQKGGLEGLPSNTKSYRLATPVESAPGFTGVASMPGPPGSVSPQPPRRGGGGHRGASTDSPSPVEATTATGVGDDRGGDPRLEQPTSAETSSEREPTLEVQARAPTRETDRT